MLFAKQHINANDKYTSTFSHLNFEKMCNNSNFIAHSIPYTDVSDTDRCIYVYNFRNSIDVTIKDISNLQEIIDVSILMRASKGLALIVLCQAHECHEVLESSVEKICTLLEDYSIPQNSVIILNNTCERKPVFEKINNIKVCHFNFFELAVKHSNVSFDIKDSHTRRISNIYNNTYQKRFLCLNRQPKDSRYETVFNIWKHNILTNTLCSLQAYNENVTLFAHPHSKQLFSENEFQTFTKILPLKADDVDLSYNQWNTYNSSFIENTGINIITETLTNHNFCQKIFFTEKIFKSILYTTPFIVIAQPYFLYKLKYCGYQTFSSLWSESYDNITDWNLRLSVLIDTIKYLNELSNTEFNKILKYTIPITLHNYLHLIHNSNDIEISNFLDTAYRNVW